MTEASSDDSVRSRYVIGIDLGTTNSAMCFVDTDQKPWRVETFRVTQWVDVGVHEQLETLPSFHYELTTDEIASLAWRLPWETATNRQCVGTFARDAGQRHPGRRIASAKSWLSHDGVDRSADFLPWHGDSDVTRMSPVDASAQYLAHLRRAWDHAHPAEPMSAQEVVITLPASFDEVARELTVLAAKRAGLSRVYLIEEPQAAFYAWIDSQADRWHEQISAGQMILVCDIGGGTTDFTLIRVQPAGIESEQVQFHRVAVGKHLILGGDNLDLALAKKCEQKLIDEGVVSSLSADQWDRLVQAARVAKETMLSSNRPENYTVSLPSQGAKLIGGAIQVSLSATEVDEVLVDGFFPRIKFTDRPSVGQSGFREFGLPYAADPAVTKHLAAFLSDHRRSGLASDDTSSDDRPAWLLFNGGVMAAPAICNRITESISNWLTRSGETTWQPKVLASPRLDLAVARGAAYYAMVRRGEGVKITANLGRSYYMQVSSDPQRAICLISGSAQAGERFSATQHPLELQLGQPVQFPLWSSSTRLADRVGELITINEGEASQLPPIYTALTAGKSRDAKTIRVAIESELSEIGTVGMWCVEIDSGRRWQLDFDIRSTLETDRSAHDGTGEAAGIVDDDTVLRCDDAIRQVFESHTLDPNKLVSELQERVELKRDDWPPSLLRKVWQILIDQEPGRRKSPQHEARWLNLLGYCLRPGYGVAVDDWRVSKTWKAVYGKLVFAKSQSRCESLVLWRRIAGGMSTGQQQQLAGPLISALKDRNLRLEIQELSETWRLLGSLERLPVAEKIQLGQLALQEMTRKKSEPIRPVLWWTVGRLGSRSPAYGPLNATIGKDATERWLTQLLKGPALGASNGEKTMMTAVVQLARFTGDRHRDLSADLREQTIGYLKSINASEHAIGLVAHGGDLTQEQEAAVFGEALPLGIRLAH
jgi:molecular chaperone DnaK (HSP70)